MADLRLTLAGKISLLISRLESLAIPVSQDDKSEGGWDLQPHCGCRPGVSFRKVRECCGLNFTTYFLSTDSENGLSCSGMDAWATCTFPGSEEAANIVGSPLSDLSTSE